MSLTRQGKTHAPRALGYRGARTHVSGIRRALRPSILEKNSCAYVKQLPHGGSKRRTPDAEIKKCPKHQMQSVPLARLLTSRPRRHQSELGAPCGRVDPVQTSPDRASGSSSALAYLAPRCGVEPARGREVGARQRRKGGQVWARRAGPLSLAGLTEVIRWPPTRRPVQPRRKNWEILLRFFPASVPIPPIRFFLRAR